MTYLKYDCDTFVVTMVALKNKSIISANKESSFVLKCSYPRKKYLSKLKQHRLPDTLSEEFSFKCLSVKIYEQFIASIVELIMLSWQPKLFHNFHNMRVTRLFYHFFKLQVQNSVPAQSVLRMFEDGRF